MGKVTRLSPASTKGLSAPTSLEKSHDTSKFFCGHPSLDDWLKNTAYKAQGRSARTYVVCKKLQVVGYYCVATGGVMRSSVPGRLARNMPDPVPAAVIGRLAVDKHFERQGIGGAMLRDALQRILQVSDSIGMRAVIVHAIDAAADFYRHFGFMEFPAGTRTLFLPLETISKSI